MANLVCLNELKGVGVPCTQVMPITDMFGFVLARPGFTFDDAEAAATLANWLSAIANGDLLPVHNVQGTEQQKVEDGIYTSNYGDKTFNWEGKRGKRVMITASKEQHEILRSYGDKNFEMFRLDRNNNIHCVVNPDGTIQGISLSYFHVYQQTDTDAENPAMTPIEYQEEDPGQWDAQGSYISPSFRIKNIKPVTHVSLTCSTVDTNAFTATVAYVTNRSWEADGTAKSIALTGLDENSFKVIDQTGALNVLSDVTESTVTDGVYTVTGTTLTSGTAQVIPTSSALYKSDVVTLTAA